MIGTSFPEYAFILVSISVLRLIGPGSVVLVVCAAAGVVTPPLWLVAYATCEATFLGVYILRRRSFNQPIAPIPPRLTRPQRRALFERCTAQIPNDYPSGWFLPHGAEIKRDNVADWVLWALFASTPENASPEWRDEIDEYISMVETSLGRKLESGRVEGVDSLRLSFDAVKMVHRPLVWYLIVSLVDMTTAIFLLLLGFKHYAPPGYLRAFPPRAFTSLVSKRGANAHFPYWYRPPRGDTPTTTPLLFLHGIGIGLHPYVPFIRELLRADPTRAIVLIEFLPISMRMTAPMPPCSTILDSINTTLESLAIPEVVLAAHSYGTFITAHIIRASASAAGTHPLPPEEHDPALVLNRKIRSVVLIDPIPFLLHLPAIAYNFLYRTPGSGRANEWQLWFFASRDADVARTLSRGFFWEDGCLWREDLALFSDAEGRKRRVTVALAGKDQIVPSADVREYLAGTEGEWGPPTETCERWVARAGALEVLWFPGLDHATVFETAARRRELIRVVDSGERPVSYGSIPT
ncbi:hypothetical protein MKEN_01371900 [Mycena kentingensis (nom. inval.)]|nr:hypothetical protein MKEN_01371900 [Mycena kentingensis (nom. inval.)]